MGWKGTIRSISAALRAAEREAQRQRKAAQKQQMADDAAAAVAEWQQEIDELTSVHVDLAKAVDWKAISEQPKPDTSRRDAIHAHNAKAQATGFKHGFSNSYRGSSEKQFGKRKIDQSDPRAREEFQSQNAISQHKSALDEWEADTDLARRLLAGDPSAILEVISEMQTLSEQSLIGTSVSFSVVDGYLHAMPVVHTEEIIPNYRRKQLASGALSQTDMPSGQFHMLYQDYVASVALKIAGDLFCMLPLDELFVTCQCEMLNPKTGHKEVTPILSVKFVRQTFSGLNLAGLDPSDSMKNFNHSMSFKKNSGFGPTEPLLELD